MSDPQGIATFPSLNRITNASFTLSHGVSPSTGIITVDYQATTPTENGTLSFQFGSTRINLPDCRLNTATATFSRGRRIQFTILDRRWKWQEEHGGGIIWGQYNHLSGDRVKKTPQELCSLLLDAMGESGYDVRNVPNDTRPEVNWLGVNPAAELAKLCDSLGCRVVLHLDNRVRIHRQGKGANLPTSGALTHSYGIDPPERPDRIVIIGKETRFQSRLKMEPICQDTTGLYVHPDELSWKPSRGWKYEEPRYLLSITDQEKRKLAIRDVFYLFRITGEQFDGSKKVPGYDGPPVTSRYDLLPLGDKKLEKETHPDTGETPVAAEVFGKFYDNIQDGLDAQKLATFTDTGVGERYPGGFSIDTKLGHVRFSEPVYTHAGDTLWEWPELYIETSYAVTDNRYHQKAHHAHSRDLPGKRIGTGEMAVTIDGLQREIVAKFETSEGVFFDEVKLKEVTDSKDDFNREADHYIDQHARKFERTETADVTYAGIVALDLDGLRQQVTWKVGGGPATTQCSLNSEHNYNVTKYEKKLERVIIKRDVKAVAKQVGKTE